MHSSPNLERSVSPHELGFLELDIPIRQQVVSGAIFLSGSVTLESLTARVGRMVQANPQYRCRIVGDKNFRWQLDEQFELARHCVQYDLGDASRDDVLTFVGTQAAQGFSAEPTWRIALLNFRNPETNSSEARLRPPMRGQRGFKNPALMTDGKQQ